MDIETLHDKWFKATNTDFDQETETSDLNSLITHENVHTFVGAIVWGQKAIFFSANSHNIVVHGSKRRRLRINAFLRRVNVLLDFVNNRGIFRFDPNYKEGRFMNLDHFNKYNDIQERATFASSRLYNDNGVRDKQETDELTRLHQFLTIKLKENAARRQYTETMLCGEVISFLFGKSNNNICSLLLQDSVIPRVYIRVLSPPSIAAPSVPFSIAYHTPVNGKRISRSSDLKPIEEEYSRLRTPRANATIKTAAASFSSIPEISRNQKSFHGPAPRVYSLSYDEPIVRGNAIVLQPRPQRKVRPKQKRRVTKQVPETKNAVKKPAWRG